MHTYVCMRVCNYVYVYVCVQHAGQRGEALDAAGVEMFSYTYTYKCTYIYTHIYVCMNLY